MSKRDYYEVLGVSKSASQDDIKKAYRKLAVANHPDTHPNDKEAEDRFKEASEAYEILSDESKRKSYDQFGFAGVEGGANNYSNVYRDFGDLFRGAFGGFGDIFGGMFGGRNRNSGPVPARGADLKYTLYISFSEAVFGTKKEITFNRQIIDPKCNGTGGTGRKNCPHCGGSGMITQARGFMQLSTTCPHCKGQGTIIEHPCEDCHGSGLLTKKETISVNIPAGADNGTTLNLNGMGNAGTNGGPYGNLLVVLYVSKDKYFKREGVNVSLSIPISTTQAILGDEIIITNLEGNEVKVNIPAGTQSGAVLRLKGQGIKHLNSSAKGDLFLDITVVTPKKLSKEEKDILTKWKELEKPTNKPTPKKY